MYPRKPLSHADQIARMRQYLRKLRNQLRHRYNEFFDATRTRRDCPQGAQVGVIRGRATCVQRTSPHPPSVMTPVSAFPVPTRSAARAAAFLVLALSGPGIAQAVTLPNEWRFTVRLDGKPIGTHRFVLESAGDRGVTLGGEAQFDVTLLGVPLYRYRHQVSERWTDGCLASIDARTDDNGRLTEVRGQARADRFDVQVRDGDRAGPAPAAPAGCLMSFAYWNPALSEQKRLLDPGTGRIESVLMSAPTTIPADLQVEPQPVRGLRIGGLTQPIDVWYAGDRWVGLDTTVSGGRRLTYRLR